MGYRWQINVFDPWLHTIAHHIPASWQTKTLLHVREGRDNTYLCTQLTLKGAELITAERWCPDGRKSQENMSFGQVFPLSIEQKHLRTYTHSLAGALTASN